MSQSVPAPSSAVRTSALPVSTQVAVTGVFAALIAVASMLPPIPVGGFGVPITLQTFAVMLTGIVLGARLGFLAVALYLVAGLAGLPVFSGFSGGLGVLAGPSAGYLLAFPLAAALAGALTTLVLRKTAGKGFTRWVLVFLSTMLASFTFVHPMGIGGMMLALDLDFMTGLGADMVFWPGDVIKNVLATATAVALFRAFPSLAQRRW